MYINTDSNGFLIETSGENNPPRLSFCFLMSICKGDKITNVSVHLGTRSLREKKTGLPDFSCYNIPKGRKMYQITTKFPKWPQTTLNGRKIYKMAIKYTNILKYKVFQNIPKSGYLLSKYTIWQPRKTHRR
jgi:hypothetical protein